MCVGKGQVTSTQTPLEREALKVITEEPARHESCICVCVCVCVCVGAR